MALLERVTTLLRANINDLIDKAEEPEKMLKQLVLDMENQLLQVKTQVAIAIADQHLLENKRAEQQASAAKWNDKAALAVVKGRDDMAREALSRALSHAQMENAFAQQMDDQRIEAEALRSNYFKLQQKLAETRAHCDLLISEHRRARAIGKAEQTNAIVGAEQRTASMDRYKSRVISQKAVNEANRSLAESDSLEDRFATLERDQQIEALLEELKTKKALTA